MEHEGREALRVIVRGRVQGVGFRHYATQEARRLGLSGYVRNLSDGRSVEVVAEGARSLLETLLGELRAGPSGAHVEDVATSWSEASGAYAGFVPR